MGHRGRFQRVFILALIFLLSACSSNLEETAVAGRIDVTPIPRVSICHATGIEGIPYVEIAVSRETAERHRDHGWDIIPAPLEGCPEGRVVSAERTSEALSGMSGPAQTPRPAQATCATEDSVADALRADGRLSRLAGSLEQAGLMDMLDEFASLTIFAPTDQALDSLPDDVVDEWFEDEGRLNALLLYHAVEGAYTTGELAALSTLETISGELIAVRQDGGDLLLNGSVRLLEPDQPSCNGVLHVIDSVLLPPILEQETNPPPPPPGDNGGVTGGNTGGDSGGGRDNTGGNSGGNNDGGSPGNSSSGGGSSGGSSSGDGDAEDDGDDDKDDKNKDDEDDGDDGGDGDDDDGGTTSGDTTGGATTSGNIGDSTTDGGTTGGGNTDGGDDGDDDDGGDDDGDHGGHNSSGTGGGKEDKDDDDDDDDDDG